jgi:hypothetical protein
MSHSSPSWPILALAALVAATATFALCWRIATPLDATSHLLKAQAQLKARAGPDKAAAAASPHLLDAAAHLCTSPIATATDQQARRVQALASLGRVRLLQWTATPASAARLASSRLSLRARGAEAELLAFVSALAAQDPPLIFDRVSLSPTTDGAGELELAMDARLFCAPR